MSKPSKPSEAAMRASTSALNATLGTGIASKTNTLRVADIIDAEAHPLVEALKLMISPARHLDGCLWKSSHWAACQCGYHERINLALEQARAAISDWEGK